MLHLAHEVFENGRFIEYDPGELGDIDLVEALVIGNYDARKIRPPWFPRHDVNAKLLTLAVDIDVAVVDASGVLVDISKVVDFLGAFEVCVDFVLLGNF